MGKDNIEVLNIPNIGSFELQNSDKFMVIHLSGDEEKFKHTDIESVAMDLFDSGIREIAAISAI